jgi:hypothetical protein
MVPSGFDHWNWNSSLEHHDDNDNNVDVEWLICSVMCENWNNRVIATCLILLLLALLDAHCMVMVMVMLLVVVVTDGTWCS